MTSSDVTFVVMLVVLLGAGIIGLMFGHNELEDRIKDLENKHK